MDLVDNVVHAAGIGVVRRVPVPQRVNDLGLDPLVELLHEALWFFLFGHMFVPFGKREFFGSGQLAFARLRRAEQPPGPLSVSRPSYPEGIRLWRIILASALIRIGWRLQCETSEQGKPRETSKSAGGMAEQLGGEVGMVYDLVSLGGEGR